MRTINDQTITLRPQSDGATAEIMIAGRPTGHVIDGIVLEAALACDGEFVLFVTTDTPYEETLSIYLIDGDGVVLDSACIGAPYATGSFSNLRIAGPDSVRFRFIGGTDWTLRVLASPRFRLPFAGNVRGVRQPFGFRRRLIIDGNPEPQD